MESWHSDDNKASIKIMKVTKEKHSGNLSNILQSFIGISAIGSPPRPEWSTGNNRHVGLSALAVSIFCAGLLKLIVGKELQNTQLWLYFNFKPIVVLMSNIVNLTTRHQFLL